MIKSVFNYPVSQLFDIDAGVIYGIPQYQREYTWGKSQWETLFDDLQENAPGYFLGSTICINQTNDTLSVQDLEVVDGQQRLTTLSLLFAAVYITLRKNEEYLDDEQRVEVINLKRKLVLKKSDDKIRLRPQIQNSNLKDYLAVMAEIGVIPHCEIPPYAGNRKIFRAYNYFRKRINDMINIPNQGIVSVIEFLDKINQACLVKIEVANHADAYTLFESLNNRGMPLTAIDLIKNKLLAGIEKADPGKTDFYFSRWNTFLSYLNDDYTIQERFLRQYYNAFKSSLNNPFRDLNDKRKDPLGPLAMCSNLIQIYEKLIDHNPKVFLDEIYAAAKQYSLFITRETENSLSGLDKSLKDLDRIQGSPSYLLLLYLFVRQNEHQLDRECLNEIVILLVCFFVRRNLTDLPPTRDLTRLFMDIIENLTELNGKAVFSYIRQRLVDVSAPDLLFKNKLEDLIYEENTGVTRFILCALAEQAMTKETFVDLWKSENKKFIWTIEHIFPQSDNIPPTWARMISPNDVTLAKDLQKTHVHKLGNLTITGFNSNLGNKSFQEKRDRTDREGRSIGYKNGLKLNEDLINTDS